jgi:hypothetical protein
MIISRVRQQHNQLIWKKFLCDLDFLLKEYNLKYRMIRA